MKNTKKAIILGTLGIIFLILGFSVKGSTEGILFDLALLKLLHKTTNPIILQMMKFVSFLGSWKALVPGIGMLGIYLLYKGKYYESRLLIINILGSFMMNHLLKSIFQRTRPLDFFRVKQGGLSFPSGHSMVTMSMYLAIAYLLTENEENKLKKKLVYSMAILIILLMGISRIYLGVHWPTDIIGGYIMGYILFNLSILIKK